MNFVKVYGSFIGPFVIMVPFKWVNQTIIHNNVLHHVHVHPPNLLPLMISFAIFPVLSPDLSRRSGPVLLPIRSQNLDDWRP
jgi:hypothetical protein